MGIFDRIRKIFSSSDSSTTRNNRFDHEPQIRDVHGLTTEFNREVRPNRDFNVSSNATERPLASALCHSSTTSVAAQTSNTPQIQPDTSKDNVGNVKPSEFGQNLKHKTSSTLISAVSENGGHISTVEVLHDVVEPPSIRKSVPKTQANLRSSSCHVVKGKHIFSYTSKTSL